MATLLMPAAAGAANRWREPKAINIAHQGGENEFPSTTLYAFKRAVRAGADMLELDIGVTRDGRAHSEGYAWNTWFGDDDRDEPATWRRLVAMCVDGIMTSRPVALERVLRRIAAPASCRR